MRVVLDGRVCQFNGLLGIGGGKGGDGLTATRLHFGDRCVGCYGWMPMTYLCSVKLVFA